MCQRCGAIEDFQDRAPTPCLSCGGFEWGQLTVVKVCDFCGDEAVSDCWRYPARSFPIPSPPGYQGPQRMSEGDWSACDVCHRLIEAGKYDRLSKKSTDRYVARNPEFRPYRKAIQADNAKLHRLFARHRAGEATPDKEDR